MVELSTRLQLQDKPHLNMAIMLKEKGWARKVEVKEGNEAFSVHVTVVTNVRTEKLCKFVVN